MVDREAEDDPPLRKQIVPSRAGELAVDLFRIGTLAGKKASDWCFGRGRIYSRISVFWLREEGTGSFSLRHRGPTGSPRLRAAQGHGPDGASGQGDQAVRLGRGRSILIIAHAKGGFLEAWTLIPTSDVGYVNRQKERVAFGQGNKRQCLWLIQAKGTVKPWLPPQRGGRRMRSLGLRPGRIQQI